MTEGAAEVDGVPAEAGGAFYENYGDTKPHTLCLRLLVTA